MSRSAFRPAAETGSFGCSGSKIFLVAPASFTCPMAATAFATSGGRSARAATGSARATTASDAKIRFMEYLLLCEWRELARLYSVALPIRYSLFATRLFHRVTHGMSRGPDGFGGQRNKSTHGEESMDHARIIHMQHCHAGAFEFPGIGNRFVTQRIEACRHDVGRRQPSKILGFQR